MMETYVFDDSDFHFEVRPNDDESKFDRMLISLWNLKKNSENVFWYRLNILRERIIDNKFLLQLNTDRATLRRPPANIQLLNQAFDPNGFNFNKVKDEEKLFAIVQNTSIDEDENKHLVLVNVSPHADGHILLVPVPTLCLPQVLTESGLHLAVQLCLVSNSSQFRVCFNSLGAYASVNHLHFHGYYLRNEMYLESCSVENIAGPCFAIRDYPAKGFVFQIRNENEVFYVVRKIFMLVELLQTERIPHNLFITRGKRFESLLEDKTIEVKDCLRIYLWARKPSWGMKELTAYNIACCELFGHLVIKNENDFDSLASDDVQKSLNDATDETYKKILHHVASLFR